MSTTQVTFELGEGAKDKKVDKQLKQTFEKLNKTPTLVMVDSGDPQFPTDYLNDRN